MNHTYSPRSFNLPSLTGLSPKQVEVHLKLYEGYVKFVNTLRAQLADLRQDSEKNAYALGEVMRRFGFEFNGMRMHEYYFEQWEGGAHEANPASKLAGVLTEKYGDWQKFIEHFRAVAMMRGIGWTILYWDPKGETPHVSWVNEHELGQLVGLPVLLALDMWEHAYMVDYTPTEKAKYVDAFFANLHWPLIDQRFESVGK